MGKIVLFLLLITSIAGCVAPLHLNIPAQEPAPLQFKNNPHVALVLGGGGARGYAHVGVIKALKKAGIAIDLIVGTSAGGVVGALYADSADAELLEQIMVHTDFFDLADFSFLPPVRGPITGRRLQRYLLQHMQARWFKQLRIPLVVVTTDLQSGQAKALSSGPIPPAIQASAAMPGAVRPVDLYGHVLIDGGMVAQVPVNIAKRYHPDIIIAVNLEADLPKRLPTSFVGIFQRAFDISIHAIAENSGQGADVTIHPIVGTVGIFDLSHKQDLIRAGEQATKQALPKINALLHPKKKGSNLV